MIALKWRVHVDGTEDRYSALLSALREATARPGGEDFTRANLIELLDILSLHLGDDLASKVGELDDGTEVAAEHAVAAHLAGLVSALRDLGNGLRDPVLEPKTTKQTARRRWRQRQEDKHLIDALDILWSIEGKRPRKLRHTARKVAEKLSKAGYTRKGSKLTGRMLYSLYFKYKYQ